jgi:uncharacterized membrane protein (Fun14 family)
MGKPPAPPNAVRRTPRWRRTLVIGLVALVTATAIWRAVASSRAKEAEPAARTSGAPAGASGFAPGTGGAPQPQPDAPQEPKSTAPDWLPFVTEGGISMLIGIALGVATRTVFKFVAILVALLFITIQFMSHKGWITGIDWGKVQDWVLNVPKSTGIVSLVKYKLPSAGSLVVGYWLGLKKG